MKLAELTYQLLIDPESVPDAALDGMAKALTGGDTAEWRSVRGAVAATVIQQRDGLQGNHALETLITELLTSPHADAATTRRLLEGYAARRPLTPVLAAVALGRREDSGVKITDAINLASRLAGWCPESMTWADLIFLARRVESSAQADFFLATVVERWLSVSAAAEERVAPRFAEELEAALGSPPRWRHTRELIRRRDQGGLGEAALEIAPIGKAPARIVVVQNLEIGQGDEIFRLGPLLAMLLALAPRTYIDVVSRRLYLWDHPRLHPVSIDDEAAVRACLDAAEGFAWTDEPAAVEIRHSRWLPSALRRRAEGAAWVIEMVTRGRHPEFRRLRIANVDQLPERRAEPPRDAYETLERLALRLGIPWVGEPGAAEIFGAPFIGCASEEAERVIAGLRGDRARPLAVVQPFGGFAEVKGYTRGDAERLVRELEALVGEGFHVVLLPAVEAWASMAVVKDLLRRLDPAAEPHVVVAPDPAARPVGLQERDELSPQDLVMRLFKFLVARADLVVAVEGWACHLASLLGRPVRMVLWAGSFTPDWYPRGAEWAAGLSPRCALRSVDLSHSAAPPVLSLPDRGLLALAVAGIERKSHLANLLPKLFGSLDPETRAIAVQAAGPHLDSPPFAQIANRALEDPAPAVRAAAATAWLARPEGSDRSPVSRATLEAHRWIDAADWPKVLALGDAALAALAVAAKGDPDFTRRQARHLLQAVLRDRTLRQRVGNRASGDPGSPPGGV